METKNALFTTSTKGVNARSHKQGREKSTRREWKTGEGELMPDTGSGDAGFGHVFGENISVEELLQALASVTPARG